MPVLTRPRNDPGQYDDLAAEWWRPRGAFEPLHWLAKARAELIPNGTGLLLDLACGGGLLAPHVEHKGYRHVGVDIGESAVRIAREHGVTTVRGDVLSLPVQDTSADVVVAGEVFEHVRDLDGMVAEIGRVLKPGGTLVCDTLADTRICTFLMVTVAERLPVVPSGIHDPALFVDPRRLQRLCATNGIDLKVRGLRPSIPDALAWQAHLKDEVRMLPTRWTGVVYQGVGVKR
ncbi:MAG TPA: methyltransferase domain-containing protein [Frankiaceae bacterium]|nr:methyltransferase domain-containing protein [Frankiaceae bacterium]